MTMNNCQCGRAVRLGAYRLSINRKRGVAHYIAHMDATPLCGGPRECAMLKPYPKREEDKPRFAMVVRWNHENSATGGNQPSEAIASGVNRGSEAP